ncbi:uncharacterized protein LOC118262826 isoform X1 [Spodoptera frugiperda]|uniref:Uncharacterized protein LOC118262826 isoform X1 n=1 Tax=Spodoptera frugiperda TaxID=7108 RepID=A0A9R0CV61_SPOFR|nr:uncharacterized protein LOC118262826 isoform X1 [Spodoptera frugiperda]
MEWNNESVLEFIELMQAEPDIWDPKRNGHKNRNNINDAWNRIRQEFSVPCTVDELKRKRNTLLTQYRDCLKKINDSIKSGCSAEDVYKPSWFAFEALDNFMGDIYKYRVTISTEVMERTKESPHTRETKGSASVDTSPRPESPESCSYSMSGADAYQPPKRQRRTQDFVNANACDLYGQLLAEKLKALDTDDRLVLMNEIDNLVFKYTMNARQLQRELGIKTQ